MWTIMHCGIRPAFPLPDHTPRKKHTYSKVHMPLLPWSSLLDVSFFSRLTPNRESKGRYVHPHIFVPKKPYPIPKVTEEKQISRGEFSLSCSARTIKRS